MKKIIIFLLLFSLTGPEGFSQQLPYGTCGVVYTYDAAGNRTLRTYFCNNGEGKTGRIPDVAGEEAETTEFQYVDALYPNPSTGRFTITFSKPLNNASISIVDNTGKPVASFRTSGNKAEIDLSSYAAGIYYVRIEENGQTITKKVVKQ